MPPRQRSDNKTVNENARKGQRTRVEIIEAGYRLFLKQGYHATTMRRIAKEAGLALGAAYNHFEGKEDIFIAVLLAHHPSLEIMPALQVAQGDTAEAVVRNAAARMVETLGDRGDVLNLMFIELVELEGKHVSLLFEHFYPRVAGFAERLMQFHGALRDLSPASILRSFLGLFFSYFMTERLIGSQLPPEMKEGAFDQFVDIYLHGILA